MNLKKHRKLEISQKKKKTEGTILTDQELKNPGGQKKGAEESQVPAVQGQSSLKEYPVSETSEFKSIVQENVKQRI
jgi:hypothetical protein